MYSYKTLSVQDTYMLPTNSVHLDQNGSTSSDLGTTAFACRICPTQIQLVLYRNALSYLIVLAYTGLQLRKSEQNGFHDNFLFFQQNRMM